MNGYNQNQRKEIEKAVVFMVRQIENFCDNEKPLVLHSFRVGNKLMEMGVSKEAVIAGFLHDLIEDTKCEIKEIKDEFGEEVAELVLVLTFDKTVKDYKKRWNTKIPRIIKAGKEAMMIKITDAMDNLPYYSLIVDQNRKKEILWKHRLTISLFKKYMDKEKIFTEYKKMVENL